jgi:acetyl esterase/lipase
MVEIPFLEGDAMRTWVRILLPLSAAFLGAPISSSGAAEAGKLLSADTKVIVTLNLRRILSDHRDTPFVQRYLDQWRLALNGDQKLLKNYYRLQELHESEGISEKDFLAWAKVIKAVSDALGIDPLEDIDQITFTSSGVFVVEGRFKQEKFKPGIQQIGKDYFGSCKLDPPGDVWKIPAAPDGTFVSLVDAKTLAITSSRRAMDDLLALAAGKQKEGLAKGMRTLLDAAGKEHVGIVLADVDRLLDEFARFLKGDVAKSVKTDDFVSKFIVTQGADAIQKYAKDISAAGLGLSFRDDDVRIQLGLNAKTTAFAKDLHGQVERGNFWGALTLKASDNALAQGLAKILMRQRVSLKETTLSTQTEVPYDFVTLAAKGPRLVLLSKDFAPEPNAGLAQTALDAVSTRVTNIPLWTLPARDKSKPLSAGTFDVLEVRDVTYKSGLADPVRHRMDMYLPKDKKEFPVLVLVHGGAWFMGDNRSCGLYPSVGQFLASQGIGVVMPNYRLFPGVKHPEHAKDVARAVAWTHANIHKHGGDPMRLYLAGHSAGGHLVALLAADESYLQSEGMKPADIKGVIALSGVYRIPSGEVRLSLGGAGSRALRPDQMWPLRGDSSPSFKHWIPGLPTHLNLFAPIFGDAPRECDLASPVSHVHKGMPPLLLLVAEHDLPTLPEMAGEFQQALVKNGCEVRLQKLAKRNHNSLMFSAIRPDDPTARAMLEFIRK